MELIQALPQDWFHNGNVWEAIDQVKVWYRRFLSDLALRGKVAVSTQNQAFNALRLVGREVRHTPLGQPVITYSNPTSQTIAGTVKLLDKYTHKPQPSRPKWTASLFT